MSILDLKVHKALQQDKIENISIKILLKIQYKT